jgi:hypothetical protein
MNQTKSGHLGVRGGLIGCRRDEGGGSSRRPSAPEGGARHPQGAWEGFVDVGLGAKRSEKARSRVVLCISKTTDVYGAAMHYIEPPDLLGR